MVILYTMATPPFSNEQLAWLLPRLSSEGESHTTSPATGTHLAGPSMSSGTSLARPSTPNFVTGTPLAGPSTPTGNLDPPSGPGVGSHVGTLSSVPSSSTPIQTESGRFDLNELF